MATIIEGFSIAITTHESSLLVTYMIPMSYKILHPSLHDKAIENIYDVVELKTNFSRFLQCPLSPYSTASTPVVKLPCVRQVALDT